MRTLLGLSLVLAACNGRPAAAAESPRPLVCETAGHVADRAPPGNPAARKSAQKGLRYLAQASQAWTEKNHCFGCHVQAVTIEALDRRQAPPVRRRRQGPRRDARRAPPRRHRRRPRHRRRLRGPGVGALRRAGRREAAPTTSCATPPSSLALQQQDGSVPDDDARLPVTGGTMHTTYQAMQTWRQAFARTADDKWLTPMRAPSATSPRNRRIGRRRATSTSRT